MRRCCKKPIVLVQNKMCARVWKYWVQKQKRQPNKYITNREAIENANGGIDFALKWTIYLFIHLWFPSYIACLCVCGAYVYLYVSANSFPCIYFWNTECHLLQKKEKNIFYLLFTIRFLLIWICCCYPAAVYHALHSHVFSLGGFHSFIFVFLLL